MREPVLAGSLQRGGYAAKLKHAAGIRFLPKRHDRYIETSFVSTANTPYNYSIEIEIRKLLKPRARSVLRGMINHLLPIEVEVVL